MGQMLYLECAAGASGDMLVAALLDAGADEAAVLAALESLPAEGFSIAISRVTKNGIDACDFDVRLDEAHENHDHDMAYLYGHLSGEVPAAGDGHGAPGEELRPHEHSHAHGRQHAHRHGAAGSQGHDHAHRNLADVTAIIEAGAMTEGARRVALRIFGLLAEAEAEAHGVPVGQVHFHEVGAIDSIADIVAIAVAFDSLGIDQVVVTEVAEGTGTVRCQHGIIPVPVPAVVSIARRAELPLAITQVAGELVTPTGAAALAALRTSSELPARFVVSRVGIGAGKRDYATSGILRAMVIEER